MTHHAPKSNAAAPALPEPLPPGERMIWQGGPTASGLALHAFHIREVALYFGLVGAWRAWSYVENGSPLGDAFIAASWLVVPASASIAVLCVLAYAFARAARYTITDKRVLLQFGVALPMTLNVPLTQVRNAALKPYRDGTGDIPLELAENKASWLLLWPHVRPWCLTAQPMLRSVPDAAQVAAKLAEALSGKPAPAAIAFTSDAPAHADAMSPTAAAV